MEKINLEVYTDDDDEAAYLYLPSHPGSGHVGVACRQTNIAELIKDYKGPDIYFDFDKNDVLIGIEILT